MSVTSAIANAVRPSVDLKDAWLVEGRSGHIRYGRCGRCRRLSDDDGRPLLVAKRARARLFRCLECWIAERRP